LKRALKIKKWPEQCETFAWCHIMCHISKKKYWTWKISNITKNPSQNELSCSRFHVI
jgi:hypothetical protein